MRHAMILVLLAGCTVELPQLDIDGALPETGQMPVEQDGAAGSGAETRVPASQASRADRDVEELAYPISGFGDQPTDDAAMDEPAVGDEPNQVQPFDDAAVVDVPPGTELVPAPDEAVGICEGSRWVRLLTEQPCAGTCLGSCTHDCSATVLFSGGAEWCAGGCDGQCTGYCAIDCDPLTS